MSALQTFLLVVDHDKEEAKRIADTVAQGTCDPPIPRTGFPRLTCYRCGKQKNYLD